MCRRGGRRTRSYGPGPASAVGRRAGRALDRRGRSNDRAGRRRPRLRVRRLSLDAARGNEDRRRRRRRALDHGGDAAAPAARRRGQRRPGHLHRRAEALEPLGEEARAPGGLACRGRGRTSERRRLRARPGAAPPGGAHLRRRGHPTDSGLRPRPELLRRSHRALARHEAAGCGDRAPRAAPGDRPGAERDDARPRGRRERARAGALRVRARPEGVAAGRRAPGEGAGRPAAARSRADPPRNLRPGAPRARPTHLAPPALAGRSAAAAAGRRLAQAGGRRHRGHDALREARQARRAEAGGRRLRGAHERPGDDHPGEAGPRARRRGRPPRPCLPPRSRGRIARRR